MPKRKKTPTTRRPKSRGGPDNSALIREINPPDEVLRYDPAVMQALQARQEKENERIQTANELLQKQLYRQIFPWWVPDIQEAMGCPLREDWEGRVQKIYARADEEWTMLSGLPPLVRWNNVNWRRAANLAGYSGDDPDTIVAGLVVRFTTNAPENGPWSKPNGPKQWAGIFGISWDTLKRRFAAKKIRHRQLSSKSYQIHVDDLPQPQVTPRSSPQ